MGLVGGNLLASMEFWTFIQDMNLSLSFIIAGPFIWYEDTLLLHPLQKKPDPDMRIKFQNAWEYYIYIWCLVHYTDRGHLWNSVQDKSLDHKPLKNLETFKTTNLIQFHLWFLPLILLPIFTYNHTDLLFQKGDVSACCKWRLNNESQKKALNMAFSLFFMPSPW